MLHKKCGAPLNYTAMEVLGFDPKSDEYKFFMVMMTPEMAQYILDNYNFDNRNFYKSQLAALDKSIAYHGWQRDGGVAVFNTDGNLIEAQHRLDRIVANKITVPFGISLGAEKESFEKTTPPKQRHPVDQIYRKDKSVTKLDETALRQLLDAGTLSNLPAGFKSRGMKVRDDDQPIQPGEFRDVDAPGGNIRDQFQLLPFKEPSQTLFNLMGFCVDAGRRFAATTDTAVGEGNQAAAVGTTIALMERGSRVMSAIHKRCYYAMRQEFKLLSKIIAEYLPPEYPYAVYGADRIIKSLDFDSRVDILPVADPNIFSMSQRVTLAQTQLQIAQTNPQLHNLHEAYTRVYEALGTKQIPELLKPEVKPFPKDPAIENADALQMKIAQAFSDQDHDAHIAAHSAFLRTRMVQINPPVYALLQGHISQHVSFKAQKEVMAMMQQNQQMMMMAQQNQQQFQVMMASEVAKRIAQITSELAQAEMQADGTKQDPLIMLKQRELDLRAMDMQRRAETDALRINNQDEQFEDRLDFDKVKLEVNDEQSDERLEVAREKMNLKNKGAKNG